MADIVNTPEQLESVRPYAQRYKDTAKNGNVRNLASFLLQALDALAAETARREEADKMVRDYQDMLEKCALAAGITTPLELIAKAESDAERYGDILARIIAEQLATARGDALQRVREGVAAAPKFYAGRMSRDYFRASDILALLDGAANG